ncbi:MAG: hypothetical protein ACFFB0_07140 [Promethearchaeota archaeon]
MESLVTYVDNIKEYGIVGTVYGLKMITTNKRNINFLDCAKISEFYIV